MLTCWGTITFVGTLLGSQSFEPCLFCWKDCYFRTPWLKVGEDHLTSWLLVAKHFISFPNPTRWPLPHRSGGGWSSSPYEAPSFAVLGFPGSFSFRCCMQVTRGGQIAGRSALQAAVYVVHVGSSVSSRCQKLKCITDIAQPAPSWVLLVVPSQAAFTRSL